MKNAILLFLLFILSTKIFAQWTSQTSGTTNHLWDACHINDSTIIVVGQNIILKSTNNGTTWSNKGDFGNLHSVDFLDSQIGFAIGPYGDIVKTTDGGDNWFIPITGNGGNFIRFVSPTTGWIVGNFGLILKTTDSGDTWNNQTCPVGSYDLFSLYFVNESIGFIAGDGGLILKTTNGGSVWETKLNGVTNSLRSVYFTSSSVGYTCGQYNILLKTTDGGDSWSQYSFTGYPPNTLSISSIYFQSTNVGYAVCSNGTIFKTINEGNSWNVVSSPTTNTLYSVSFGNQNDGLILGVSGTILTYDGGDWVELNSSTNEQLNSVYFFNSETGWACGSNGIILETTNSGQSWNSQNSNTSETLNFISFFSSDHGWCVGNNGTILYTSNGGSTWVSQSSGVTENLWCVKFLDSNNGFATGDNGVLINSTDSGSSWLTKSTNTSNPLLSISFPSNSVGYISGANGIIFKSNDSGISWSQITSPTSNHLRSIFFLDENLGWTIGWNGSIFKTTNGGSDWTDQSLGNSYNLRSTFFISESSGFISGDDPDNWNIGLILNTSDGGNSWNTSFWYGTESIKIHSIFFCSTTLGYAVADYGRILSTGDDSGSPLPVELSAFSANVIGTNVKLNWKTENEINNYGFAIERKLENTEWKKIGFVNGSGNSNSPKNYTFVDKSIESGKYFYRLKQIDNDGKFEYSNEIEITITQPLEFTLAQNFPNPFNPTTTIYYELPTDSYTELKIFDVLGREIKILESKFKKAGKYNIEFDGSILSSGIYFYQIKSGDFVSVKKMLLIK